MNIRSQREIYRLIEKHLKESDLPKSCVDLMDIREIEEEALSEFGSDKRHATNKLSDTLGFMWRRGLLSRYPVSGGPGQMARYGYMWAFKDEGSHEAVKAIPAPPPTRLKSGVVITETDDGVVIEFDKFRVIVQPK